MFRPLCYNYWLFISRCQKKTIQSTFELKQRRSGLEMYTREIDCQELER